MSFVALFSGITVVCVIIVIASSLLIYRQFTSSSPAHPEMESPGFESVFIASSQCPRDDGESRTGRTILAHGATPMAPDQDARSKAVRQGCSSEGLQAAHERQCRSKCPTPVNQPAGPIGTQSQEEDLRETSGNKKSQEEGSVEVNGDENEDRETDLSRIPRNQRCQNRRSKRRTAEQGPRSPSHGKKHKIPNGEGADTNAALQGPQQAPQTAKQKKIDRIPSEIIRELSTNKSVILKDTSSSAIRNTPEKDPQGTRHGKRAKQENEISPHRCKAETKDLKPSRSGHALAIQENPLSREYNSGLIMHGTSTGNLVVGRANMGIQGPHPKSVFQQQGPTVTVARGQSGYVHQHPMYIGYYTPTGHSQNHRPTTTLPGNYRKDKRIHQPASDLELRRVMSHHGINESAYIGHATPTLTPMPLAIPHQHLATSRTSPRLLPCYSPIVLSPARGRSGNGLSTTPSPRPRGGRRAEEGERVEERCDAEHLYDQLASESE